MGPLLHREEEIHGYDRGPNVFFWYSQAGNFQGGLIHCRLYSDEDSSEVELVS